MDIRAGMLLCLLWSGYEDIKEQKIRVLPVIVCMILGMVMRIRMENLGFSLLILDAMPGVSCFVMSRLWNHFLGDGDSLLILCVGLIHGFGFCLKFVFLTFTYILIFSMIMLGLGKMTRRSVVPCVPFMVLGFVGAWLL